MLYKTHKPVILKRYARFILALFVLSVFNISMQAPAHAVMKIQMQQSSMQAMSDCQCPPSICDSVLALDNQSLDGLSSLQTCHGRSSILIEMVDQNSGQLNQQQHSEKLFLNVSLGSPPTLLIKTLLLI